MNESVTVAKETDAKKGFSSTHKSDERIHRARNESERQLGSLGDVIDSIKSDGAAPSAESIATQLSNMHTTQRAPVLLALQQTHGNRYVQRVVSGIQAKLTVGQPGDKYEQEADRVADAVMRMPEPGVQRQIEPEEDEGETLQPKPLASQITPLVQVQRQEEPEEEEEEPIQAKLLSIKHPILQRQEEKEEELLHTKELTGHGAEVALDLESRIQAIQVGGQPLPKSERAFFEPRFGHDFSQVRLHTAAQAADTARAVNAKAFTIGRNVVFGSGQYAPGTHEGRRLMAHELVHVVQQKWGVGDALKSNGNAYEVGCLPVSMGAIKGAFTISRPLPGLLVQKDDVEGFRAREVAAGADLKGEGWTVLSDDDSVTRKTLNIPKNEPASDLLARKGSRSWLIGESKGRDPSRFITDQGPNTYKYLKKLYPDAKVQYRVYVKSAVPLDNLGSGLSARSGFLIKKMELGEVKPGVEHRLAERMVRINGKAVHVRGGSRVPSLKIPPKAPPKPGGGPSRFKPPTPPAPKAKPRVAKVFPPSAIRPPSSALLKQRQNLIAAMNRQALRSRQFAGRVRIYSRTVGGLLGVIGMLNTAGDVMTMYSSGTIFPTVQRQANLIRKHADLALRWAQEAYNSVSFLVALEQVDDAIKRKDMTALFNLSEAIGDVAFGIWGHQGEFSEFSRRLKARSQALKKLSDIFLDFSKVPGIYTTAPQASALATRWSLQKLAGTLNAAASEYGKAAMRLKNLHDFTSPLAYQANREAWKIFGENLAQLRQLEAERKTQGGSSTLSD